jgi:hypothetical protein
MFKLRLIEIMLFYCLNGKSRLPVTKCNVQLKRLSPRRYAINSIAGSSFLAINANLINGLEITNGINFDGLVLQIIG